MPARRVIRSLASAHPAPSRKASTSLLPPYSYSNAVPPAPPSSFRPPYTHTLASSSSSSSSTPLSAPYRFSLVPPTHTAQAERRSSAWNEWAKGLLATTEGREQVWRAWVESVVELEKVKSSGNQIPQVSFHTLQSTLSNPDTLSSIANTGTLVVRDVVADSDVHEWSAWLLQSLRERNGRPVYWHDSLVAARAHPSVLSANKQVLSALSGVEEAPFVQVDAAQVGIGSEGARTTALDDPWAVDENALHPTSPVLSHLALTPSSGTTQVSSTIHSAIYASLRSLFKPSRSLLSFYHASAYLDPANWTLVDSLPTYPPSSTPHFPHLQGTTVALPRLNPGDMVFRNTSIPVSFQQTGDDQVFLPVTPLPRIIGNTEYVARQREAYEEGLPPPHVLGNGLVALEESGDVRRIGSSGGRRAMGY